MSERETGVGSSLRVGVRRLMISGKHQAAGTSQGAEPGGAATEGSCDEFTGVK